MPGWLIALIILLLLAMASQNENSTKAGKNSQEGYQRGTDAEYKLQERFHNCGSRCDDVRNDYQTHIEKE